MKLLMDSFGNPHGSNMTLEWAINPNDTQDEAEQAASKILESIRTP